METSTIPQLLDDTKLVEDTTQPPPETKAVTQPLPDVDSWMQPFVDCEDGLVDMEANLNHDLEKDLLEYFSKCFKKVFIQVEKDAEGNILETLKYTDKIGFYDTFKNIRPYLTKGTPIPQNHASRWSKFAPSFSAASRKCISWEPSMFQLLLSYEASSLLVAS